MLTDYIYNLCPVFDNREKLWSYPYYDTRLNISISKTNEVKIEYVDDKKSICVKTIFLEKNMSIDQLMNLTDLFIIDHSLLSDFYIDNDTNTIKIELSTGFNDRLNKGLFVSKINLSFLFSKDIINEFYSIFYDKYKNKLDKLFLKRSLSIEEYFSDLSKDKIIMILNTLDECDLKNIVNNMDSKIFEKIINDDTTYKKEKIRKILNK